MHQKIDTELSPEEREALFDELEATLYSPHALIIREQPENECPSETLSSRHHTTPEELDRELEDMCEELLADCLQRPTEEATSLQAEQSIQATEQDEQPNGDFPQTNMQTPQRRFSASVKPDSTSAPNEKALTCKNAASTRSGDFPQETPDLRAGKKRCTPGLAGVLVNLHRGHQSTLAVLGELQALNDSCRDSVDTKIKDEIGRRTAASEFQKSLARSAASGVALPDWERRLPSDTKRAFALLALAQHPDAKSISFRLGHEVAEAAMRAQNGPTDYLARILQRLGLVQMVFALERSASASDENNPYHIHGVAIIPAALLDELTRESIGADGKPKPSKLRAALAPPPNSGSTPPIRGYRQRGHNKAIDIQTARTAGSWFQYITKEFDFTAHYLESRPDYASRSATQAGRALYESIRRWITTKPAQDDNGKPQEAPHELDSEAVHSQGIRGGAKQESSHQRDSGRNADELELTRWLEADPELEARIVALS